MMCIHTASWLLHDVFTCPTNLRYYYNYERTYPCPQISVLPHFCWQLTCMRPWQQLLQVPEHSCPHSSVVSHFVLQYDRSSSDDSGRAENVLPFIILTATQEINEISFQSSMLSSFNIGIVYKHNPILSQWTSYLEIVKNVLKRRKESGTYLATDSRHHWRVQMTMKNDK